MTAYERAMEALSNLFGKDCTFVFATAHNNIPSARVVDTYFTDGGFWAVTYATTAKVRELESNPHVALCNNFYTFKGKAYNMGHPLKKENEKIRAVLTTVFAPWYFDHNNEEDADMCYVKIIPESGYFHQKGVGYHVDFREKRVEEFPFAPEIEMK